MENVHGEEQKFYLNGKHIKEKEIRLEDNGTINEIEVVL